MRIAIVGPRHIRSNYSGIERALSATLPHLAERGHEVTVYSGPPPSAAAAGEAAGGGELWRGVRSVVVPAPAGKHAETLVRSALATVRALRDRPDLVHFTHQGPGLFCPAVRAAGAAAVVSVPGIDWQRAKWGPLARAAIRAAERVAVGQADGIIALSRGIQRYFAETHGREARVIPNGIERPPPATAPGPGGVLARHGLRPGGFLLFAARLVPEKACHELIEAWNGVAGTDLRLVVAGAGGNGGEAYVRSLRAAADPAKVVFTGHVEGADLAELFAHAYAFVLPSHLEGQSVALLEALGHGRAVLVSDIAENLDTIAGHGFAFRVGDVSDLRARLAWLAANPEAVRAMEAEVRGAAEAWPDWRRVALLHEEAYAAALAARRAPRRPRARAGGEAGAPRAAAPPPARRGEG